MGKIRLLQFPIANSKGGITHYALENWKWMDKTRFLCDFVTMSKHLDFEEEILATGSRIFHISCYAEEDRERFIKEFDEILDNEYDIVHLHTKQWKSFLVEELCKKRKIKKVIVHSHNTGIDTSDPYQRDKEEKLHEQIKHKFDSSMATDFWACSRLAADFLFGEQIPAERIRIMPNAIDLSKYIYRKDIRHEYRKKHGLEEALVIGQVGRFSYQKNHEFMINVFYDLLQEEKRARLVLVGDGKLMPQIMDQVKSLGLVEKVIFLGQRDDVNCWYQAMDILCLPSRFEGFPLTLVEAQAAGLPCVTSNCVTEEVDITKIVAHLPLVAHKWVEQILIYSNKERADERMRLVKAGYSLMEQVQAVEEEYAKVYVK